MEMEMEWNKSNGVYRPIKGIYSVMKGLDVSAPLCPAARSLFDGCRLAGRHG